MAEKEGIRLIPKMDSRASRICLVACVFALAVIGLIMVYSSTSTTLASEGKNPYEDMIKQLVFVGIGTVVMFALWYIVPYRSWRGNLMWGYYWFCMILVVLTFAIGTEVNGARRWLYFGPIGFQPSEFVKIALLLMTINIVYDYKDGFIEFKAAITRFLVAVMLPLAFIYMTQSDMGSVAICFVGIFAILWLGGISGRYLAVIGIVIFALGMFAIFGVGYRSSRMVFIDPWNDGKGGLGDGYNIIHAYYAIAEGGLFGVGIGSSHEKYAYLFASDSDFIFAIICEETGMFGALVVIALFVVILYAGLRIAADCPDGFGKMISGGLAIMLVFQAFLNIGCTIGVFPTTGKPLPFISSGGSSAISSLMIIGLMLSVSRGSERATDVTRKRDNIRIMRNVDRGPEDYRHPDGHGRRPAPQASIARSKARRLEMDNRGMQEAPMRKRYRFKDLERRARGGQSGQEHSSNRRRDGRSRVSGSGPRRKARR